MANLKFVWLNLLLLFVEASSMIRVSCKSS